MATYIDLAQRMTEHQYDEEFLGFLLWNHTCYPHCGRLTVARQLRLWDRRRRAGWSDCVLCGKAYRNPGHVMLGGECGGDHCETWDALEAAERGKASG